MKHPGGNRVRGTEQNYRYLADGSWNPQLTPKQFYAGCARRIFGEKAPEEMTAAFETLEENEEFLGWTGRGNFSCCGVLPEISVAYGFYNQPNPFDGPEKFEGFVKGSHQQIEYFTRSAQMLAEAFAHLDRAGALVAPRGRNELEFLRNKAASYRMLDTPITSRRAYILFDEAFQRGGKTTMRSSGRSWTRAWPYSPIHHGRQYTTPVAWDKIYYPFPQFGRTR